MLPRSRLRYLLRAKENNIRRAEMFFDPQTHCYEDTSGVTADTTRADYDPDNGVGPRKLPFALVVGGLLRSPAPWSKTERPPANHTSG